MLTFVEQTMSVTTPELLENRCRYHESCYASFPGIGKLQRVEKCYANSVDTEDSSAIQLKSATPSLESLKENDPAILRARSK